MHSPYSTRIALILAGALALWPARTALSGPHKHHGRPSVSAAEAASASYKKAEMRKKLRGLSSHMHVVRSKIIHAKHQEHMIRQNMDEVEAKIDRARASLSTVNDRLTALDHRHDVVVRRMEATQEHLAQRRKLLSQRVADNYRRGQATYANVLIGSRSVHELLSRGFYVRKIVESDADLIKNIRSDLHQIKLDKRELERQATEQHALADEFEARKTELAGDLEQKREILQDVKATRAKAEEELDELESESEEMTSHIREWTEMLKRRQQEIAAQHSMPTTLRGKRHHLSIAEGGMPTFHGGFLRPCDGPRTSGFGMRFHPILHRSRMHTGVDFGAPYGAPIRAAASGIVILAAYNHGYGNCVVILHSNSVSTLYGHCSSLLVSEGQQVSAGQVIARVGATGLATGPHLHFEVRHNGTPVSPPF
jgi:murein DD-endopeptidase MepM/ murein hydrolase activator NlpD